MLPSKPEMPGKRQYIIRVLEHSMNKPEKQLLKDTNIV